MARTRGVEAHREIWRDENFIRSPAVVRSRLKKLPPRDISYERNALSGPWHAKSNICSAASTPEPSSASFARRFHAGCNFIFIRPSRENGDARLSLLSTSVSRVNDRPRTSKSRATALAETSRRRRAENIYRRSFAF